MKRTSLALLALLFLESCGSARVSVTPNQPKQVTRRRRRSFFKTISRRPVQRPQFERSFWSVLIRPADANLDADQAMFAAEPGKLMMPGSNMKILTLAAAAEVLGWDYRFETKIITPPPSNPACSAAT